MSVRELFPPLLDPPAETREGRADLLRGLSGLDIVYQRQREDVCRQIPPGPDRLRGMRQIDEALRRDRAGLLAALESLACEDLGHEEDLTETLTSGNT
jgi:hypothetical protein